MATLSCCWGVTFRPSIVPLLYVLYLPAAQQDSPEVHQKLGVFY